MLCANCNARHRTCQKNQNLKLGRLEVSLIGFELEAKNCADLAATLQRAGSVQSLSAVSLWLGGNKLLREAVLRQILDGLQGRAAQLTYLKLELDKCSIGNSGLLTLARCLLSSRHSLLSLSVALGWNELTDGKSYAEFCSALSGCARLRQLTLKLRNNQLNNECFRVTMRSANSLAELQEFELQLNWNKLTNELLGSDASDFLPGEAQNRNFRSLILSVPLRGDVDLGQFLRYLLSRFPFFLYLQVRLYDSAPEQTYLNYRL